VPLQRLRSIAHSATTTPDPLAISSGPVGVFTTGGSRHLESDECVLVAKELELTNLGEIASLTGLPEDWPSVLSALYSIEGWKFVRRLRGGFAFALWDRRKRQLMLAVDRFGLKRLYYAADGSHLAFATKPSALLKLSGIETRLDPTAAYDYMRFGFVPAPLSMYSGIRRLPPGRILLIRDGHITLEPYWDLNYPERPNHEAESAETVSLLMEEAIRDAQDKVPAKHSGVCLRGRDLDGSIILGLMGRALDHQVNTFSVRLTGDHDSDGVEKMARQLGAAHHETIVTAGRTLEILPELTEVYDEPFEIHTAIPAYLSVKLGRECGISHFLAGDGGRGIFGGSERFRLLKAANRYGRIPAFVRQRCLEPILRRLPDGGSSALGNVQRLVEFANLPILQRFYSSEWLISQEVSALLAPDFLRLMTPKAQEEPFRNHYERVQSASELNRLLYLDMKLMIGDRDLSAMSTIAKSAGVTVRFPLLDERLVEYVAAVPPQFKERHLATRDLFRRTLPNLPPSKFFAKAGPFCLPLSAWMTSHKEFNALVRETLLPADARTRDHFRPQAIEHLLGHPHLDMTRLSHLIGRLLILELWQRRYRVSG
jgi:asparagine synthase (glutamine-hydrolysing)